MQGKEFILFPLSCINRGIMPIFIKGAGDLATAVALRLHRTGYQVIMSDISKPTMVRRTVSFAEAVYSNEIQVEEVRAAKATLQNYKGFLEKGIIPILVDIDDKAIASLKPHALVDAIIAKKNLGTYKNNDYFTIALGPGFKSPSDVDVVIETMRGHYLGRCIYEGSTLPNTGVPGEVGGYTNERVLRAKNEGFITWKKEIGDFVNENEILGILKTNEGEEVIPATITGILRGLLSSEVYVTKGFKIGDIDPRCAVEHCFSVSDKGLSLGGAVLEALIKARIFPY